MNLHSEEPVIHPVLIKSNTEKESEILKTCKVDPVLVEIFFFYICWFTGVFF